MEQSKEDKTDEEIIKFLELNPSSRYGSIWDHIQELREKSADLVSQKIFNKRLERLCENDDARVTKTTSGVDADGKKISDRMPRYSMTEEVRQEVLREMFFNNYLDSMSVRIKAGEGNSKWKKDEEVAYQFFTFYSELNHLSLMWRIKEEISPKKLGRSYQVTTFKKKLAQKMEEVSSALKKLPAERKKKIFENIYQKVISQKVVVPSFKHVMTRENIIARNIQNETSVLNEYYKKGLFGQPGRTLCEACEKPIRKHSDKQLKVCERKIKSKKVKK